ncbi:phospholipid carrier-dependent glycosyltransferase [Dactylosporangium fulvum]|uniref:Polyprenol-phosphate-mannose--protein mannosyltransferase n=1 Tax=Dactylosporangium fulvum TaxID=53359 RepID=A0ABY5VMJ5_9ACTN|nr:phospholipid carrier-dependent glycosyltransferase [Dactylosporangium fulvum]UWP78833.1 phospholipid carrier-dependent glycosyltransferase [Dactylosporangium fulvum]
MTSGVLTETSKAETAGTDPVPDIVRRRLAGPGRFTPNFWLTAILVTGIGLVLRLVNLSHPKETIFDEVYYANEAWDLLQHGVEWNPEDNTPQYVVHPPLGKWMIALGEQLFGYNSFGWRIMAVIAGMTAVLLITMAAWRLFRSTILAGAAGLLMSLDGMHFVLSRAALLDIFLMFWIVVAFYFLVLDREQRRTRWLHLLETGADPNRRPKLGVPYYRLACAVALGLACGVKWSGLWYVILFAIAALVFDISTRRSAGARHWITDSIPQGIGWSAAIAGIVLVTYLGTWWGWFASDDGYFRHWYAATNGLPHDRLIDPLVNLWHYHQEAYKFHTTLDKGHPYQSWPWQWLLLGRPVAFHWDATVSCSASSCASAILLLGTPLLWWSFLPALIALGWLAVARRDGRAWLIMACALAGILPWFQNMPEHRTMFYFYALPAEPFLVLAVVYVLGAIIGPARHLRPDSDQRLVGSIIAGAYILLVAACFAYFYPIYSGMNITYAEWFSRMWLGSRWI